MEEKEFRIEKEKIETDKRASYSMIDDIATRLYKKIDGKLREAITETKHDIKEDISNRYEVEKKILNDRRERERRRR